MRLPLQLFFHYNCLNVKFYILLGYNTRIMNLQILHNKAKSIGLAIFIICCGIPLLTAFMMGIISPFSSNDNSRLTQALFNPIFSKWLNILSIIGMLIYMLSKEKIEDVFITKLRLESFQITLMLLLFVTLVLLLLDDNLNFNVSYVIYMFIFTYLIIFYLKKRLL